MKKGSFTLTIITSDNESIKKRFMGVYPEKKDIRKLKKMLRKSYKDILFTEKKKKNEEYSKLFTEPIEAA